MNDDLLLSFIQNFEISSKLNPIQSKNNILDFERGIINFDIRYRSLNSKSLQLEIQQQQKIQLPVYNNAHYGPLRVNNMFQDLQILEPQQLQNKLNENLIQNILKSSIRKQILNKDIAKTIIEDLFREFYNQESFIQKVKQQNCISHCYKFDLFSGEMLSTDDSVIETDYKTFSFDTDSKGSQKMKQKIYKRPQNLPIFTNFEFFQNKFIELVKNIQIQRQQIDLDAMYEDNMNILKFLSLESTEWVQQSEFEQLGIKKQEGSSQNMWDTLQLEINKGELKAENLFQKTYNYQLQNVHSAQEFLQYINKISVLEEDEIERDLQMSKNPIKVEIKKDEIDQQFKIIRLTDIQLAQGAINSKTGSSWAVDDEFDLSNFYELLPREEFAMQFDFELDDFQKRAILHLERQESVLVCAHTSAGKTVIAEYAIALSQKHGRRVVYTSPIKALSNEKYRKFSKKYYGDVGIITGDVTLNPQASCLIMTTEILRNMLYKGNDMIRDIEWVIFDEVHYVNNIERGVVWEESIIMLPEHIGIIMLSATVPNYKDFANWVGRTKQRQIFIQKTFIRPVPLEHSIYIFNKFQIIKEQDGPFLAAEYEMLKNQIENVSQEKLDIMQQKAKEKMEKEELGFYKDHGKRNKKQMIQKQASKKFISSITREDVLNPQHRDEQRNILQLISHCQTKDLLPCVFFIFSKAKIQELAEGCGMLNLVSKLEASYILKYFDKAVKKLKESDQDLPQLIFLRFLLKQGIAVHHGDMLPIAKEIVEILFSEGLLKVLFATETFAMGINMPTKTVIFHSLKKHDGQSLRLLNSSEYTQMSGRAGRRGIDEKGNVIVFMGNPNQLPEKVAMAKIVDHKGEQLESKYRITYAVILNKLNSKELDVVDMMRQSFSENSKFGQLKANRKKMARLKEEFAALSEFDCPYQPKSVTQPALIENYYFNSEDLKHLNLNYFYDDKDSFQKIQYPKFCLIIGYNNSMELGVILSVKDLDKKKDPDLITAEVLMVNEVDNLQNKKKQKIILEYEQKNQVVQQCTKVRDKNYVYKFAIVHLFEIMEIFQDKIQIKNLDRSHQSMQDLALQLISKMESFDISSYYSSNSKKKQILQRINMRQKTQQNIGFEEEKQGNTLEEKIQTTKLLLESKCISCEQLSNHLSKIQQRQNTKAELQTTLKQIDENELKSMDILEGRIQVLKVLKYIDENNQPLIKARIARELSEGEIFLCEIIVDNVLSDLSSVEIAAVLSGFVCQFKSRKNQKQFILDYFEDDEDGIWSGNVIITTQKIYQICSLIVKEEINNNIVFTDDVDRHIQDNVLNYSLAKTIYLWANGKDFIEILNYTDAQEGQIVRTILRLENLLKNLKNAARIVGNMPLFQKVEKCQTMIKRDIVFTQSLYYEED